MFCQLVWNIAGNRVDLYLGLAATPYEAQRVFWEVTGRPRVPPKHTFGFVACRYVILQGHEVSLNNDFHYILIIPVVYCQLGLVES